MDDLSFVSFDLEVEKIAMAIRSAPDPQVALMTAAAFYDRLQGASSLTATLRAEAAMRIKNAEELSLAALGDRLGVSKARAQQLVRLAKREG